jgi:hypothetical protein
MAIAEPKPYNNFCGALVYARHEVYLKIALLDCLLVNGQLIDPEILILVSLQVEVKEAVEILAHSKAFAVYCDSLNMIG